MAVSKADKRREGMQRGLNASAILGLSETFPVKTGEARSDSFRLLAPSLIDELENVRTYFDEERMADLRESIKELRELGGGIDATGIIQAVAVAESPSSKEGEGEGRKPYVLISGARRLRAALTLGLPAVPATIIKGEAGVLLTAQVVENLQREDVSPLDEGVGFRKLQALEKLSIRDVATRIGKSKTYVDSRLNLLDSGFDVQDLVMENPRYLTSGLAIDSVENAALRKELIERVRSGTPSRAIQAMIEASKPQPVEQPVTAPTITVNRTEAPVVEPGPEAEPDSRTPEEQLLALAEENEQEEVSEAEELEAARVAVMFDYPEPDEWDAAAVSGNLGRVIKTLKEVQKHIDEMKRQPHYDQTVEEALKTTLLLIHNETGRIEKLIGGGSL